MSYCDSCKHEHGLSHDEMCETCFVDLHEKDYPSNYEPIKTPPKEEINHPSRYAGGKYECIDVMVDVFGVEAVKHFCLLNSFKYLWRSEHKGGVEDIKKAMFYMDYYIKLTEEENETDK